MRKVVWIFDGYCMQLVSEVNFQKLGRLIDGHVIHSTLHRAKEMMVKVWYICYRLYAHKIRPRIVIPIGAFFSNPHMRNLQK